MSSITLLLSLFLAQHFLAQQPGTQQGRGQRVSITAPAPQTEPAKPEATKALTEEKPIVTKHEMHLNGRTLNYTATTGMMPIKNQQGEIEANLFYVAYSLDGVSDLTKRPLMFSFNGGPGSASVWLH